MKNLKLIFLSITIALFSLSSCSSDDKAQDENPSQSVTAKSAMNELRTHFNDDGTLSRNGGNEDSDNNQTGNIIFDYCFNFEFPITLVYNTGTNVTVNDFDGLIDVLIEMTDNLYVDGIVFPFNVTVFDEATDGFVVQTITSEQEFETLFNSCGFDDVDDCVTTQEYAPVCIEIQDPSGESFVMQFPNMGYAMCEGFTQADIVECDDITDPTMDENDCFEFIYPLSITGYDGNVVVVNSDDDWDSAIYGLMGMFDFVYPIDVRMSEDQSTVTVANSDEFLELFNTCTGFDPCDCSDDSDYPMCVSDPVTGDVISFDNYCLLQCAGFNQADIVDCN